MSVPRRDRALALGLVVASVFAGCTRPALKRPVYRMRANAICAKALARQRALPPAASDAAVLPTLRRLRAVNRRLTNRIAQLDPPLGTDHSHDAAIHAGVLQDRFLGRLAASLHGVPQPLRRLRAQRPTLLAAGASFQHRWARLHLPECAVAGRTVAGAVLGAR